MTIPELKSIPANMNFHDRLRLIAERHSGSVKAGSVIAKAAYAIESPGGGCMGGVSMVFLMEMNELRLYGARAVTLLNVVCGGDARKAAAVMKSCQLGRLPLAKLHGGLYAAMTGRESNLDVDAIVRDVQERVPAYARAAIVPDVAGRRRAGNLKPAPVAR